MHSVKKRKKIKKDRLFHIPLSWRCNSKQARTGVGADSLTDKTACFQLYESEQMPSNKLAGYLVGLANRLKETVSPEIFQYSVLQSDTEEQRSISL